MQLAQVSNTIDRESRSHDMQASIKSSSLQSQSADRSTSHIFCNTCSDTLGLTAPSGGNRVCPACQSNLPNPDDAVSTSLNPTDDYKTSVLSGLPPSTIMECAGRGLAFWSYQSTQEMYAASPHASSTTADCSKRLPRIPRQNPDRQIQQPERSNGQNHQRGQLGARDAQPKAHQ